jgi:predicted AAA+ superfamily ATPase
MKERDFSIQESIKNDLKSKIVLLSGPRQVGKTTLSKNLITPYEYINYDIPEDRILLSERSWKKDTNLVIFDEIHKMKNWKSYLKGIYDDPTKNYPILVTGSARLEVSKKMGDSLAGRFFSYRLHPFDIKELTEIESPKTVFQTLMKVGGFPEPYSSGSEKFYRRWKRTHLDIILRQDLIDLESVRDIIKIETLIELLKTRVGSPVSFSSLARDLEKDPGTIKRWLDLLESLYVIFRVTPYHDNIARAILKEPKYYFYDIALVENEGARFENLVACALLKELHRLEDLEGYITVLHYLRTKDGNELDFLVIVDKKPKSILEVKLSDDSPSSSFKNFSLYFPNIPRIQLVANLVREKEFDWGLKIVNAEKWLSEFSF